MSTPTGEEDSIERQRNELALLEAMYPEELKIIRRPSDDNTDDTPETELEIRLDTLHTLCYTLPREYPNAAPAHVFLSFASQVPNNSRKQLRSSLREIVERQDAGVECVDVIAADFRHVLTQEIPEDDSDRDGAERANAIATEQAHHAQGHRVVLWMHHLLATGKRRAIVQRSKELELAGFSKPGYPGAVYVEGGSDQVAEFVRELKSWRWQAIQERGEESVPVSSLHLLDTHGPGIQEVESLSNIIAGLRQAKDYESVASFFLECMRIR